MNRVKTKFDFVKDGTVKVLVSNWEGPGKMIQTEGEKISNSPIKFLPASLGVEMFTNEVRMQSPVSPCCTATHEG